MSGRALGYRPDRPKPAGKADLVLRAEHLDRQDLPKSHDCLRLVRGVLNQANLGSCTANSALQNVRCAHVREGFKDAPLGSRLMAYLLARLRTHETAVDAGTEIRLVFETLNKFGFCPEEFWPYSDATSPMRLVAGKWTLDADLDGLAPFQQTPDSLAFQKAFDQRAPVTYRRIVEMGAARVVAVQRAIANDRPVSFGATVSEAFCEGDFGREPIGPPTTGDLAGGHAQLITGYSTRIDGTVVFEVLNSWGEEFQQPGAPVGCSLWTDTYISWSGLRADGSREQPTSDFWTCESVPNYSEAS